MTIKRSRERQPERIQFARDQRQTVNEFAADVWQMVRSRRILGAKFRREYPLGPYTLDFACVDLKIDLEIDGKDHFSDEGKARDTRRDAFVRSQGWTVLRIAGFRVTQDPRSVREEIEAVVKEKQQAPHPRPLSPKGARGASREIKSGSPLPASGRGVGGEGPGTLDEEPQS